MGRGPSLKTQVKTAREVEAAKEKGKIKGQIQGKRLIPTEQKVEELLTNFAKKVDPLEFLAILALVPIVKLTVDQLPNLVDWYKVIQFALGSPVLAAIWGFTPLSDETAPVPEWLGWLIAIGLSFLIVRHFDAIMAAGQDVAGFLKTLVATP